MNREKVFAELKRRTNEASLEELISISEDISKLASFHIYKSDDGIDMFASEGYPLFPFYAITNILYDDRKCAMTYETQEISF